METLAETIFSRWRKSIRSGESAIIDILFPVRCLGCEKFGTWICDQCWGLIPLRQEQVCPICENRTTPDGRVCFSCDEEASLAGLLVASAYSDPILSKAIQYLKYRFVEDLSMPLGRMMAKALSDSELPLPEVIIPIPLHRFRLHWRGFNQSALLAQYLSDNMTPGFPIPVETDIIRRIKFTYPQMKIKNYQERLRNIQGVFEIEGDLVRSIKDKRILLVDDVATTGATLFECARALKDAGAGEIFAVVLARQEIK